MAGIGQAITGTVEKLTLQVMRMRTAIREVVLTRD
jgi:hypothetical protein